MTRTLTTKALRALRDSLKSWQDGYDPVDDKEQYEMFVTAETAVGELLANREAQPVALNGWSVTVNRTGERQGIASISGPGVFCMEVPVEYSMLDFMEAITAPPAPAVPEEINPDSPIIIGILPDSDWTRREKCIAADMWNACRAAMLAQPVSQGYKLNSPEIPDGCQWTYDEHDYKWDSACGEAWMFSDGGPIENGVKFCQSCGKPVLLAAAPEGGNG